MKTLFSERLTRRRIKTCLDKMLSKVHIVNMFLGPISLHSDLVTAAFKTFVLI